MQSHLVWFTVEQWAKIAPHSPANQPGLRSKDDRLILSGIMHVRKASANFQLAQNATCNVRIPGVENIFAPIHFRAFIHPSSTPR
jgi:hypothetical protein